MSYTSPGPVKHTSSIYQEHILFVGACFWHTHDVKSASRPGKKSGLALLAVTQEVPASSRKEQRDACSSKKIQDPYSGVLLSCHTPEFPCCCSDVLCLSSCSCCCRHVFCLSPYPFCGKHTLDIQSASQCHQFCSLVPRREVPGFGQL